MDFEGLDNLKENMDMKNFAKEVLLEENYEKFMQSYKFTFWFQTLGILAGFIIPCIILVAIYKDTMFIALGAGFGVIWIIIWLIISQFIPQTRIYRQFSKWYRKSDVSLNDLDKIFYK